MAITIVVNLTTKSMMESPATSSGVAETAQPFVQGRRKFFSSSAAGKDIVLIAQCLENREFADLVFEDFAGGKARSIYSLNLTTRDQADDPRIASIIAGC